MNQATFGTIARQAGVDELEDITVMAFGHIPKDALAILVRRVAGEGIEQAIDALDAVLERPNASGSRSASALIGALVKKNPQIKFREIWPQIALLGVVAYLSETISIDDLPSILHDNFGVDEASAAQAATEIAVARTTKKGHLSDTILHTVIKHSGLILGLVGTAVTKNPKFLTTGLAGDEVSEIIEDMK